APNDIARSALVATSSYPTRRTLAWRTNYAGLNKCRDLHFAQSRLRQDLDAVLAWQRRWPAYRRWRGRESDWRRYHLEGPGSGMAGLRERIYDVVDFAGRSGRDALLGAELEPLRGCSGRQHPAQRGVTESGIAPQAPGGQPGVVGKLVEPC